MCMNIGDRIKKCRCAIHPKKSQQALADCINVSRPTITDWENSKYEPSSKYIPMIAKCLGCSLDFLLSGKDAVPPQLHLGDSIDNDKFLECYTLWEDAVMMSEAEYSLETRSQCLVKMYESAVEGKSPAQAMLQYLTSLNVL